MARHDGIFLPGFSFIFRPALRYAARGNKKRNISRNNLIAMLSVTPIRLPNKIIDASQATSKQRAFTCFGDGKLHEYLTGWGVVEGRGMDSRPIHLSNGALA